jgi:hypothetical protein
MNSFGCCGGKALAAKKKLPLPKKTSHATTHPLPSMADPPKDPAREAADEALKRAIAQGNVNISSNENAELLEVSAAMRQAQERHAQTLLALESKRRARRT